MPILKQTTSTFTLCPAGTHPARCYAMISLGTQPSNNPAFKPTFKVVLQFELPNESIEVNGVKKPMMTSHFLSAYLGSVKKPSKANLFLTSWRGRPFTETELAGFDLSKVVGAPCLLNIVHEDRNGQPREVIAGIMPLPKGMTVPPQFNKSLIYEVEQGRDAMFQTLPEWIQNMLAKCAEWNPAVVDTGEEHHSPIDPDDVPMTTPADDTGVPF